MEEREGASTGMAAPAPPAAVIVATAGGSDVVGSYPKMDPPERAGNNSHSGGGAVASVAGGGPVGAAVAMPTVVSGASPVSMGMKKKRGRPRKYGPDGSLVMPLSLMPLSASMPSPPREFTLTSGESLMKQWGRGRTMPVPVVGSVNKQQQQPFMRIELGPIGELAVSSTGPNFMPHIITVDAGEDVTTKILSFSQQGPQAICVLSANGVISNITLHQPDSAGGTLTYEGRFELLSLSGSFIPTENGGIRSRSGGLSVSLVSPSGRVIGGALAGFLVAASPLQVVVGTFMPYSQADQKVKKPKPDSMPINVPTAAPPISTIGLDESYGGVVQHCSVVFPKPNLSPSSSLRGHHWASLHSASDTNKSTDINISISTS